MNGVGNNDNNEATVNNVEDTEAMDNANNENTVTSPSPQNIRSNRNTNHVDKYGAYVSHMRSNSKSENNYECTQEECDVLGIMMTQDN